MSSKVDVSKVPMPDGYGYLVDGIGDLLEQSRRQAVRAVNSFLTSTYWEICQTVSGKSMARIKCQTTSGELREAIVHVQPTRRIKRPCLHMDRLRSRKILRV